MTARVLASGSISSARLKRSKPPGKQIPRIRYMRRQTQGFEYLIPETVEDLQHHECLSFSPTALSYWLGTGEDVRRRSVSGRLQINNGQALRIAALNGMGIVLQSTLLLEEDIQAGRLIQLFPEQGLPSRPMSVVYLPDRYHSTKLRSFVAFLMEHFPPMARV